MDILLCLLQYHLSTTTIFCEELEFEILKRKNRHSLSLRKYRVVYENLQHRDFPNVAPLSTPAI